MQVDLGSVAEPSSHWVRLLPRRTGCGGVDGVVGGEGSTAEGAARGAIEEEEYGGEEGEEEEEARARKSKRREMRRQRGAQEAHDGEEEAAGRGWRRRGEPRADVRISARGRDD